MAIKLNQGADATIVGAAYRAAIANTPGDYGRTFEKAAESYGKTMKAQSETFGNIVKLGSVIGGRMIANAQELTDMSAKANQLNPDDAAFIIDEIYGIKDAQKELFGIGFLQSRETRQKKAELKLDQQKLFAEIDGAALSIKKGTEAVAAGLFDAELNEVEGEIVNAIIKSGLKNKITEEKNFAKLGRDETTGELMYTLYKENGELADLDGSGKPVTMTIKQFNKSIATNVNDGGALAQSLDAEVNRIVNAGNKSLNGTYDPEMKQMHLNGLDKVIKTKTDLKRAMKAQFGISNTSFQDDLLTEGTPISLDLYNTLLSVTGSGEEIPLDKGITQGVDKEGNKITMEDTDGSGGISSTELQNSKNYGILAANILGMKDYEVSKAYFKEYTTQNFEAAYKYGYSKKPPVAGKTDGTDGKETDNLGIPDYTYPKFGSGKIDSYDARTLKRRLLDGTSFNFNPTGDTNDSRAYDFIGGTWYENYDNEEKRVEIGTADQLVLDVFQTNHEAFQGLSTSTPEETINIEGETTDATTQKALHADIFNKLDLNKDNAVSTSLNDYFGLSGKRKTLQFRPYTGLASEDALSRNMSADSMFTNDIMLYNPQTGKRVTDANGDTIRFKIGDDMGNLDEGTGLSKDVTRILEVLKQNGVQPPTQLP